MKQIISYLTEKLKISSKTKISKYKYHPKDKDELRKLLEKLIKERGKDADLNDIDISNITDMSYLFKPLDTYNIDISEWDVSNVTDMECMFSNCIYFNCDLSNWDVSNVTDMQWMFYKCKNFNSDLSKWDVSNVENMDDMFNDCPLQKNPPKWYHE